VWAEAQREHHARHWPRVDRLISELPPRLFRREKLVEYDLALRYSTTGQFHDTFLGCDQFPMLSIGGWLLEDLGCPPGPERDEIERRLFFASVLLTIRTQARHAMRDPASFTDDHAADLVGFCTERATRELMGAVPPDRLVYGGMSEHVAAEALDRAPESQLRPRWAAPALAIGIAASVAAERTEVEPKLSKMVGKLAEAFEIREGLASMHADLLVGRVTYPIAFVADRAAVPLDAAVSPNTVLGAMIATGSLPAILGVAHERIVESRRIATDIDLPTMGAYLADAGRSFAGELAAVRGEGPARRSVLQHAEPTLPRALAMAEGYLLADPVLRESWETHRDGMLGAREVTSHFPAGLVLEILHDRGHDVRDRVDDFLAFTVANGFRYYDHPWSDADADTVGVFLRLMPHGTQKPDERSAALDAVLACLDRQTRELGAIPVWITDCAAPDVGADAGRPPTMTLGESCGTVMAHALLGLLAMRSDLHRETVDIGAAHLTRRIRESGLGANVNYPPAFAMAAFHRLLAALDRADAAEEMGPDMRRSVAGSRQALAEQLESVAHHAPRTAQEAALLTIACIEAGRPDMLREEWTTRILKQQRSDGSWIGEPFAATPNRGPWVSWYSSSMLTTALCYDALGRAASPTPSRQSEPAGSEVQ
jgi:hypothetical protein